MLEPYRVNMKIEKTVERSALCFLVVLLVGLITTGCNPGSAQQNPESALSTAPLKVVATTSIVADLVTEIGGDHVSVSGLMGPGIDPHLYKASEGDVLKMAQADVIFYNGLHLEGKMTDVFEQMSTRGIRSYEIAKEALPDSVLISSTNFSGTHDPHVWFDVSLWRSCALYVSEILSELKPSESAYFQEQADVYLAALEELEQYVQERAAEVPQAQRVLITSHDAFGYFGEAYDFEVRALQGLSTVTEAGTADVQELADFVSERQIPALFIESSVSPRGIEAVKAAVEARNFAVSIGGFLYSDALGNPDTPEGTFIGTVRHNIDTIVEGLTSSVTNTTSE